MTDGRGRKTNPTPENQQQSQSPQQPGQDQDEEYYSDISGMTDQDEEEIPTEGMSWQDEPPGPEASRQREEK